MTEKAKEGRREGRRVSFDVRVRQIGRPTDATDACDIEKDQVPERFKVRPITILKLSTP